MERPFTQLPALSRRQALAQATCLSASAWLGVCAVHAETVGTKFANYVRLGNTNQSVLQGL